MIGMIPSRYVPVYKKHNAICLLQNCKIVGKIYFGMELMVLT
jgi:hypothetical protein